MGNINENIAAEMGDYELLNSLRNSGEAAMVPIYFTEALNRMAKASESRQRVLEQALRDILAASVSSNPRMWPDAMKAARSALAQGEPARTEEKQIVSTELKKPCQYCSPSGWGGCEKCNGTGWEQSEPARQKEGQ